MGILTIKNTIKEFVKLIYICPQYKAIIKNLRDNKESKIVLFGTPAHGNLGDQAIAISEMDFLLNIAGKNKVVEIPMPLLKTHRKVIKNLIKHEDTIIVSGGGWMGNLWIHNEITIREIVSDYLNNKVIIFPQTLYYTDDENGIRTSEETKSVFDMHSNLILTVRDSRSFNYAKDQLGFEPNKNLIFCPDMVVYGTLARQTERVLQKSALICFRNDIEKIYDTESVKEVLRETGYTIIETTTVLSKLVPMNKRLQMVQDKIKEFGNASIVITDRLHAMLFSLLSGTPCIAFDNATGKVFGVGEYLKSNGMPVYLLDEFSCLKIDEIELKEKEYLLTEELKSYFHKLETIIDIKERREL